MHLSPLFSISMTWFNFVQSVYMLTAAVSLIGGYIHLGASDASHQGSSLSDHCKTTGFSPFKLPTRNPLQKVLDHSPPKAF